jgi:hypothetical protein
MRLVERGDGLVVMMVCRLRARRSSIKKYYVSDKIF